MEIIFLPCAIICLKNQDKHIYQSLFLALSLSTSICALPFSRFGFHGKTFWHFYWDTDKAFTVYNIYLYRESSKTFQRDFQLKCLHVCVHASMYARMAAATTKRNEMKRNTQKFKVRDIRYMIMVYSVILNADRERAIENKTVFLYHYYV